MKSSETVTAILETLEGVFEFLEILLTTSSENKQALEEANAKIDELEDSLQMQDESIYESLLPALERAKILNEKALAATFTEIEEPVSETPVVDETITEVPVTEEPTTNSPSLNPPFN